MPPICAMHGLPLSFPLHTVTDVNDQIQPRNVSECRITCLTLR